ncbi:N-acetyltransferase domain-containing protein [Mycena venus]|uniref:N-acetyltransferase domain-containing protein n=1 Tax=Mycena venus TaxID=2733690 RepID=A0A8H6YDK4_9AGAR|nr:N-acetyltransferase domain-containing protein [Mycena venus]
MDPSSTSDINWAFPLPESGLETARVKLTPFISHIHWADLGAQLSAHPEISHYLPEPITQEFLEGIFGPDPQSILFAVINKEQNVFAGVIGLCNTSPHNLVTEIGPVICFPEFQRTFVNTNAIGILLRYCLNLPEEGGLGLRRVQWSTHPANTASVGAAERMGMTREGTMRWRWVLAKGKEGKEVAPGRGEGPGRDSVMLAACWDDWENGGRELVEKQINR